MIGHVEHNRSALLFDGAVKAAETLRVSLDYLGGLTDDPTPTDVLIAEVAAYRAAAAKGTSGPPPMSPSRLHLSVAAAERLIAKKGLTMNPAEKADLLLEIYLLDAAGIVDAEAALRRGRKG